MIFLKLQGWNYIQSLRFSSMICWWKKVETYIIQLFRQIAKRLKFMITWKVHYSLGVLNQSDLVFKMLIIISNDVTVSIINRLIALWNLKIWNHSDKLKWTLDLISLMILIELLKVSISTESGMWNLV